MRVWRPSSGITAPNGSVYRRDDSNQCEIAGCSSEAASTQRGVWLAEGKSGAVDARIKQREQSPRGEDRFILEITVREGMNREIRRVLARVGLRVKRLKRVRFGSLILGKLPEGAYRTLSREEVVQIKEKLVKAPQVKKRKTGDRRSSRR